MTMLTLILTFALILTAAFRLRAMLRSSGQYHHNPYRYGCRRHHNVLGGILPVVALVTLDRLFDLRR